MYTHTHNDYWWSKGAFIYTLIGHPIDLVLAIYVYIYI